MSGPVPAGQAVAEAREAVLELIAASSYSEDKARAAVARLEDAVQEADYQQRLNEPILRHCCLPGCFAEFDVNARLTGRAPSRPSWSGEGWKALRLSSADYFCPTHAPLLDEHMPKWAERERDRSHLTCQCGWTSPEAFWHGYAVAGWRDHLAQIAAARTAREGLTRDAS